MLKDKVMQMENGKSYYILDSVEYDGKLYALALECDLDKDEVNEEDYFAMEVAMDGDDLSIKHILDDNVAQIVVSMLLTKIRNS